MKFYELFEVVIYWASVKNVYMYKFWSFLDLPVKLSKQRPIEITIGIYFDIVYAVKQLSQ